MPDARPPAFWSPVWDSAPEEPPARYPTAGGTRYLLPCPVLFYGGYYEYVLLDVPQARQWVMSGPLTSFLSHPMLHEAFERLMGFYTPPARKGRLPQLSYHDDALVFAVDTYETLPDFRRGDSEKIRELVEREHFTIGLLKRLG